LALGKEKLVSLFALLLFGFLLAVSVFLFELSKKFCHQRALKGELNSFLEVTEGKAGTLNGDNVCKPQS
jgi:hypothetical protein